MDRESVFRLVATGLICVATPGCLPSTGLDAPDSSLESVPPQPSSAPPPPRTDPFVSIALRRFDGAPIALSEEDRLVAAMTYAHRAAEFVQLGELKAALRGLTASAAFYQTRRAVPPVPFQETIQETGIRLGQAALASGDTAAAKTALNTAAVASTQPVEFMYRLRRTLSPEEQTALWPAGLSLTLARLEAEDACQFVCIVNEQGRAIRIERAGGETTAEHGPAAWIRAGEALTEGRCWCLLPLYLSVPRSLPFNLTVRFRAKAPSRSNPILRLEFPSIRRTYDRAFPDSQPIPERPGWSEASIDVDLESDSEPLRSAFGGGFGPAYVTGVVLAVAGPANEFLFEPIEIRIPETVTSITQNSKDELSRTGRLAP